MRLTFCQGWCRMMTVESDPDSIRHKGPIICHRHSRQALMRTGDRAFVLLPRIGGHDEHQQYHHWQATQARARRH